MRKALRTVCDELRRVHKGNKILEEHHRALAGQLADCEVRRSLEAPCQSPQSPHNQTGGMPSRNAGLTSLSSGLLKQKPQPQPKQCDSPETLQQKKPKPSLKQGDRSSKGERRLTLRLSKRDLRKISSSSSVQAESDSGESGSEYFEANSPEEVLEMQQLLSRLASRYESRTSTKGSVAKACEEARCITLSWKIVFA